jgi:hypothetical protein
VLDPIKVIHSQDATWALGTCGLVTFDGGGDQVTDATFDNYFAAIAEPPHMSVSYDAGFDEVVVSWSADAGPFRLQSTGNLNPDIMWTDIPEDQIFSGPNNTLQYTTSPDSAFKAYRLILD